MHVLWSFTIFASIAVTAIVGAEPPKVTDIRQHFQITGGSENAVFYEVTEVIRLSDETDENHHLVHDVGHTDFVMKRVWSFKDQTITYRISDQANRVFIQFVYQTPFAARTRLETLKEARENAVLQETPGIVTIETNGGKWEAVDTDLTGENLRQLRRSLRQTLDATLLEALERMRGTVFATPIGEVFYVRFGRLVLYDERDSARVASAKVRDTAPDCSFDAGFGYRCSDKQVERVAKAAKEGRVLTKY